ncbi:hypothetical protein AOG1_15770 [Geobacter sp. AOG1]|nr:hypothetical protein AOG1_15770 [Geobacter sp. AOG1]
MLTISSCAKCGGGMFKVVEKEPHGSNFKVNFVQCSSCNAPIGVLDYYNLGTLMKKQEKSIDDIESRLSNIEHTLRQIAHHLNQRR